MLFDCLEQVVGLSESQCECLDEAGGELEMNGLSNLYIDDMQDGIPLNLLQRNKDCGDGSIWDLMIRARRDGVNDFITDLKVMVMRNNNTTYRDWKGIIGETKKSHSILTNGYNKDYLGLRLQPLAIKGGYLHIKSLGLKLNTSGIYELKVFNNLQDAPLHVEDITAVAGIQSMVDLTTPLILPYADENGHPIEYYFEYETLGAKPYSVMFNCNCTGALHQWEHTINASGYSSDDENGEKKLISTYTSGIYIKGNFICDPLSFLCNYDEWDNDGYSRVVAKALQFYAILKLGAYIINSQKIDIYTGLQKEHIWGKMSHAKKEIAGRIDFLSKNIPDGVQSCATCRESNMKMTTPIVNSGKSLHQVVTVFV